MPIEQHESTMSDTRANGIIGQVGDYIRSIPQQEPIFGPVRQWLIAVIKDFFDIMKNSLVVVALQAAVINTDSPFLYVIFNFAWAALYIQIVIALLRHSFRLFHRLRYRVAGLIIDIVISWIFMITLFAATFGVLNKLLAEAAKAHLK